MAKSAPEEGGDYNARIIKEFRANQGRVAGPWAGTMLILIHHIGEWNHCSRSQPMLADQARGRCLCGVAGQENMAVTT